jgi:predicted anti-sigma-YlaC factor YlaD
MGTHSEVHSSAPPPNGRPDSSPGSTPEEVTCQQFVELVTHYFEGVLPARTVSRVEEHLVMCDWCVIYVDQMEATIASLRELKEQFSREPPDSLLAALHARGAGGS